MKKINNKIEITLDVFIKKNIDIKPWPKNGSYACTTDGDVYHVNKKGDVSALSFVLHSPGKSHQLYKYVNVKSLSNGEYHGYPLHRMLAETFLEEPKDGKRHVVAHKNFNSLDNRLSNLEYQTWSQNLKSQDAIVNTRLTRIKNSREKGKVVAVSPDGNETMFNSVFEAGKALGIPSGWINNILQGKGKSAKGFTFKGGF